MTTLQKKKRKKKAGRPSVATHGPNPIDVHIGFQVRKARKLRGYSQEKLGEIVGLTFQQIQKYERGANRISGSRLYDMSQALNVSIGYFFEDLSEEAKSASPAQLRSGASMAYQESPNSVFSRRETLELVRNYFMIKDEKARVGVYKLIAAMAKRDPGD